MKDRLYRIKAIGTIDNPEISGAATIMVRDGLVFADVQPVKIKAQPKVDAVEVVHGHWSILNENCCVCSVCHKHSVQDYYYCPNCGAKMDGDGNVANE